MSNKLSALATALILMFGFGCGVANASNMGFKVEREFAFVSGFQNIYYLSFPLFNGVADIAGGGSGNRCAAGPDGTIDTSDAICDLFTDRAVCTKCSFAISMLDTTTCFHVTVKADVSPAIGVSFQGTPWELRLDPYRERGLLLNVANDPASPIPTNRAVIMGMHDPSFAGHVVSATWCSKDIVAVPYHTMYKRADEMLCGLEGSDWVDIENNLSGAAGSDGMPDTCPSGLFDPSTGDRVAVTTFDNLPGSNEFPNTDNANITRMVEVIAGKLWFQGLNFSVQPGEAYLTSLLPGHADRTFITPHF